MTWVRHEAGWYTLRGVGGVVKERDGWAFWPLDRNEKPIRGLPTLNEAKRVAITGSDPRLYSTQHRPRPGRGG